MSKEIALTQDRVAIVDDSDFECLSQSKWCLYSSRAGKACAAIRGIQVNGRKKCIYMHRQIMNPPRGMEVDHIDGNGLNNQRANLRICTASQNLKHKVFNEAHSSRFKGVSYDKTARKWHAGICNDYHSIHLGTFNSEVAAAIAYNAAALKYHREFASLNNITDADRISFHEEENMPRRKYHGQGQGVIQTLYISTDNMAWLRERRKSGDSMSGVVNRALLLIRNLEAVSYAADANIEEEDEHGSHGSRVLS